MNNDAKSRLMRILQNDKSELPARFEQVLRSELHGLLSNYFDLGHEEISLSLEIGQAGKYQLRISVDAHAVKTFFQV